MLTSVHKLEPNLQVPVLVDYINNIKYNEKCLLFIDIMFT
jgi:hypothetical protein